MELGGRGTFPLGALPGELGVEGLALTPRKEGRKPAGNPRTGRAHKEHPEDLGARGKAGFPVGAEGLGQGCPKCRQGGGALGPAGVYLLPTPTQTL